MRRIIVVEPEKCVGCGICELACSAEKEKAFNPKISRIRLVRIQPVVNTALACRLCEKAPCVRSCPRDALGQYENGTIHVDETKCTGCGWCIQACDFGSIVPHPSRKIAVCDLCCGDPVCVRYCPKGAIEITNLDAVSGKSRLLRVKELHQI